MRCHDAWPSMSQDDAGFTLLETLVALCIVAIGFAFAFAALPAGLGAQDHARKLEAAANLAHALLEMAAAPAQGEEGGFSWRIDSTPLGNASAAVLRGRIVQVRVVWQDGRTARNVALQSVQLGR